MTSEQLTYRLFEERDLRGLLRLWEEAGWGTLSEEQWREWYVETPNGAALVAVAVDARGEVLAQEMFMPTRMQVGAREVRALRFSAPILRREMRGESLRRDQHPVFGLYKVAAEAAQQQGFSVVYSLPEYAWLPVFRSGPRFGLPRFAEADYPCISLPLTAANGNGVAAVHHAAGGDGVAAVDDVAGGTTARAVAEFGEEYDALWLSARETFPVNCGIVRRRDWLRFRNSGRIAVEVRDASDGSLVGYTATKRQTGLLADILARHPRDVGRVVAATLKWLASERGASVPEALTHLKVMQTPALAPSLEAFGGERLDYRFAFTCHTLDASLAAAEIAPARWYLTPGD
ncbi:MAG TPA: hypothetical protein VNA19_00255 [Pyrinomonadaceae bacterium]|jgi:hypothetical protein|nr:hypothetical protein [Pyrinomonadaceae bacterium]